jgi:hypothetical protein
MNSGAIVGHDFSFVEKNETDGATSRHDTERFVRCIEYERAPHGYLARNREKKEDRRAIFISEPDSILCTMRDNQARQQCALFDLVTRVHHRIA